MFLEFEFEVAVVTDDLLLLFGGLGDEADEADEVRAVEVAPPAL